MPAAGAGQIYNRQLVNLGLVIGQMSRRYSPIGCQVAQLPAFAAGWAILHEEGLPDGYSSTQEKR